MVVHFDDCTLPSPVLVVPRYQILPQPGTGVVDLECCRYAPAPTPPTGYGRPAAGAVATTSMDGYGRACPAPYRPLPRRVCRHSRRAAPESMIDSFIGPCGNASGCATIIAVGSRHSPRNRVPVQGRGQVVLPRSARTVREVRPGTAPRHNAPHPVRAVRRQGPGSARVGETRDVRVLGLHAYLREGQGRKVLVEARHYCKADAGQACRRGSSADARPAPARRRAGPMAGERGPRVPRLLRRAGQRPPPDRLHPQVDVRLGQEHGFVGIEELQVKDMTASRKGRSKKPACACPCRAPLAQRQGSLLLVVRC